MNSTTEPIAVYVYFIAAGASPIKIGISADPFARLSDLQTAHYKELHLLFTLQCVNRAAALELEAAFHRWYADRQIRLEWYDITPGMIEDDVKLLRGLANLIIEFKPHTSWEDMMQLEQRAQAKRYTRTTDAQARAFEWFDTHKDDANTLTVRQLAELSGIGKTSIADALKVWKQQQPGALVQSMNGNGHGEAQT